jgi:uncharacterized protein YjbJ (UPF0337 family)
MDPKVDDAKGRVKEAAGTLTGNEDLKAEGAAEQASAQAQQGIDDAADAAKGVVSDLSKKAEDAIDAVKDKLT